MKQVVGAQWTLCHRKVICSTYKIFKGTTPEDIQPISSQLILDNFNGQWHVLASAQIIFLGQTSKDCDSASLVGTWESEYLATPQVM